MNNVVTENFEQIEIENLGERTAQIDAEVGRISVANRPFTFFLITSDPSLKPAKQQTLRVSSFGTKFSGILPITLTTVFSTLVKNISRSRRGQLDLIFLSMPKMSDWSSSFHLGN